MDDLKNRPVARFIDKLASCLASDNTNRVDGFMAGLLVAFVMSGFVGPLILFALALFLNFLLWREERAARRNPNRK